MAAAIAPFGPDARILPFADAWPRFGADCFVADTARVIGDVELGLGTSVWFGAVVRGDVHWIRIGQRVNIQDLTVVHVTSKRHATTIGDEVTVGHRVTLHGCTIEPRALIGMSATVMDAAVIGEEAMVGAGALVTPGTIIPPRMLAIGAPAKAVRPLRDDELEHLRRSGPHYATLAATYLASGIGNVEVKA